MLNLAPCPASLSTEIWPPPCITIPYTVDRPRPVPRSTPLVFKNGSKTRERVSASMPQPLSLTVSTTHGPAPVPGGQAWLSPLAVSMLSRPPWGMASRLFTTRLRMTCSIWP